MSPRDSRAAGTPWRGSTPCVEPCVEPCVDWGGRTAKPGCAGATKGTIGLGGLAGGRLGGMPIMERLHQESVAAAREGIGDSRFDTTFASGAACPLDQLVMHAIRDADELSVLSLAG